jgi:hypothetical protein
MVGNKKKVGGENGGRRITTVLALWQKKRLWVDDPGEMYL